MPAHVIAPGKVPEAPIPLMDETLADNSAQALDEGLVADEALAPALLPCFPSPAVVDEVLYDYLRRADRMGWSPYDLVDHENLKSLARPERLSEVQLGAVKTVLFVEDHLPGYLSEYLRIMTDPEAPDSQQIVNRKALHYTFRWVAE